MFTSKGFFYYSARWKTWSCHSCPEGFMGTLSLKKTEGWKNWSDRKIWGLWVQSHFWTGPDCANSRHGNWIWFITKTWGKSIILELSLFFISAYLRFTDGCVSHVSRDVPHQQQQPHNWRVLALPARPRRTREAGEWKWVLGLVGYLGEP